MTDVQKSRIGRIKQQCQQNMNMVIKKSVKDKRGRDFVFTYKIIEIIGNGTFGLIVKVLDLISSQVCVIKMVYQNPKYHHREIEYLCEMDHPNIINLLGYYYEDVYDEIQNGKVVKLKYYCLIFPFYVRDLEELIINNKCTNIRKLLRQALQGIEYMHSLQICHRDIKPSNILVDDNYNLVICDFGSAKKLNSASPNVSYICSRHYRAPENCMGSEYYDLTIDIWAIGVVFADYVTSYSLFSGISNQDQLDRILESLIYTEMDQKEMKIDRVSTGPGIRLSLENKGVDQKIIDVLENCIVLNPRKRKTARELLNLTYLKRD